MLVAATSNASTFNAVFDMPMVRWVDQAEDFREVGTGC